MEEPKPIENQPPPDSSETKTDSETKPEEEPLTEKTPEQKQEQQETKQEAPIENQKKEEIHNDDDSYTDIDDDEDIEELKLKVPVENENTLPDYQETNLEDQVKKLSVTDSNKQEQTPKKSAPDNTKKGKFYQHDNRKDDNKDDKKEAESKDEKWHHDKFDPKEKRQNRGPRKPDQEKPNRAYQNPAPGPQKPSTNKGLSLQEYMEQNDSNKQPKQGPRPSQAQTQRRDDQNKKPGFKKELNMDSRPTPASDLKSRLDFRTRIPTIVDDLFVDTKRAQNVYNRQNSGNASSSLNNNSNRNNAQFNRQPQGEKKFDKPFDKTEKLDIVITTDFKSATRQVHLNHSRGNGNRTNDRRQNQNTYSAYMQSPRGFNQQQSQQPRRNTNPHSYDDNLHPYLDYVDSDIGNYVETSEFQNSHIRTQTFNNRNFNNTYEDSYASGGGGGGYGKHRGNQRFN